MIEVDTMEGTDVYRVRIRSGWWIRRDPSGCWIPRPRQRSPLVTCHPFYFIGFRTPSVSLVRAVHAGKRARRAPARGLSLGFTRLVTPLPANAQEKVWRHVS